MGKFSSARGKFGHYDTIILKNESDGSYVEFALAGGITLSYNIPLNGGMFNILDGFSTPEEFKEAKGARCWIMAPFANRIPDGRYLFDNKEFKLDPVPPRDKVIHGFTAYEIFEVEQLNESDDFAEAAVITKAIRPGRFKGYPFAVNVRITYRFSQSKLNLNVEAENMGDVPAPFGTGWHPYFKTSDMGIEHLELTLDADKLIMLDEHNVPLDGDSAYGTVDEHPELDFRSSVNADERRISSRVLDNCYSELKTGNDGISRCVLFDPENGLKISVFQEGGVTLAFSGDSLPSRARQSVAIEPMQFITNAFNRPELKNAVTVNPGESSVFKFGVEIEN